MSNYNYIVCQHILYSSLYSPFYSRWRRIAAKIRGRIVLADRSSQKSPVFPVAFCKNDSSPYVFRYYLVRSIFHRVTSDNKFHGFILGSSAIYYPRRNNLHRWIAGKIQRDPIAARRKSGSPSFEKHCLSFCSMCGTVNRVDFRRIIEWKKKDVQLKRLWRKERTREKERETGRKPDATRREETEWDEMNGETSLTKKCIILQIYKKYV